MIVSLHIQPEHMGQELCLSLLLPSVLSEIMARRQKAFLIHDIHPMGPKSCWLSSSLLFIYTSYAAGHDLNLNRICWLPFISTVSGFSSSKLEGICLRKEENPIKQALQKMNLTSQILNLNINF